MRRPFPIAALLGLLFLSGCQSTPSSGLGSGSRPTAESLGLTKIAPEDLPEDPIFLQANQECVFFVRAPRDGSMVPGGTLKKGSIVILRNQDGEWTDIQLTDGYLGSVFSSNVTRIDTDIGF